MERFSVLGFIFGKWDSLSEIDCNYKNLCAFNLSLESFFLVSMDSEFRSGFCLRLDRKESVSMVWEIGFV